MGSQELVPPKSEINDLEGHNKIMAKAHEIFDWWAQVKKKLNRFNVASYSPKALLEDVERCPERGVTQIKAAITDLREPLDDWGYFLGHKGHRDLERWFDSDPDPRAKSGA